MTAPVCPDGESVHAWKSEPPRYLSSVSGAEPKQQPRRRGGGEEAIEAVQNSTMAG